MRICLVNPFFLPREGGIERRMAALGREYLRAGHDVHVVTSRFGGEPSLETLRGIVVHRVKARRAVPYEPPGLIVTGGPREIARRILAAAPDVVDFQYRWSPAYALAMERVLAAGVPAVFTFHNTFGEGLGILRPLSYLTDAAMKLHISKYDRIASVSTHVMEDLARRGFPADRLGVSHNAIEPPGLGIEGGPGPGDRDGGYGLCIGRLVRTKGFEVLLRALARVRDRRGAELPFVLAGDGPRRHRLEGLAGRLGLREVTFAGFVPEVRKWELLRGCRIFVLPSLQEAFGMVLLEAMHAGRPIVATATGGVAEVLRGAGALVRRGDDRALAEAIHAIEGSGETRERLSAAASERAKRFTWAASASAMLDEYRRAMLARRGTLQRRRSVGIPAPGASGA